MTNVKQGCFVCVWGNVKISLSSPGLLNIEF